MEDVCQYGHPMIEGVDPIVITETDPETGRILKKETKLLRRHLVATGRSRFDPTGLVPIGCRHGLRVRRDGNLVEHEAHLDDDGAEQPKRGSSWIRAKFARLRPAGSGKNIIFQAVCPVCEGEAPDPEMIRPADNSFTPLAGDLPEWAQ